MDATYIVMHGMIHTQNMCHTYVTVERATEIRKSSGTSGVRVHTCVAFHEVSTHLVQYSSILVYVQQVGH